MVLHTRGRVGRRQLFYKPLSTDLLREAFFCVIFLEARPYLKMMRPHLGATPPGEGSIPQLGNKKMYSEVIKIMHEYGYMM